MGLFTERASDPLDTYKIRRQSSKTSVSVAFVAVSKFSLKIEVSAQS